MSKNKKSSKKFFGIYYKKSDTWFGPLYSEVYTSKTKAERELASLKPSIKNTTKIKSVRKTLSHSVYA